MSFDSGVAATSVCTLKRVGQAKLYAQKRGDWVMRDNPVWTNETHEGSTRIISHHQKAHSRDNKETYPGYYPTSLQGILGHTGKLKFWKSSHFCRQRV
jgi:hypothetical protein